MKINKKGKKKHKWNELTREHETRKNKLFSKATLFLKIKLINGHLKRANTNESRRKMYGRIPIFRWQRSEHVLCSMCALATQIEIALSNAWQYFLFYSLHFICRQLLNRTTISIGSTLYLKCNCVCVENYSNTSAHARNQHKTRMKFERNAANDWRRSNNT